MSRFSPSLTRLLLVRGVARALAPIAVVWAIYDWWLIDRTYGIIYAALTLNYVLVYLLTWVAPAATIGPWRIRPIQTFILLINAFALPITYYRHFDHHLPWGFLVVNLLFFVGLYAATAIMFYLNDRLPMAGIFIARRGGMAPGALPPKPAPVTNAA